MSDHVALYINISVTVKLGPDLNDELQKYEGERYKFCIRVRLNNNNVDLQLVVLMISLYLFTAVFTLFFWLTERTTMLMTMHTDQPGVALWLIHDLIK